MNRHNASVVPYLLEARQDAFTVIYSLDYQFPWIDSMCIVQDNTKDDYGINLQECVVRYLRLML